jgi:hypothetical protein
VVDNAQCAQCDASSDSKTEVRVADMVGSTVEESSQRGGWDARVKIRKPVDLHSEFRKNTAGEHARRCVRRR